MYRSFSIGQIAQMNRQAKQIVTQQQAVAGQRKLHAGWILLTAITWLLASLAVADTRTQISDAIGFYVDELHDQRYARVEADVQPVDSRLHLQSCDQPLSIEHRPRDRVAGRLTFKVSCNGVNNWSLHVPGTIRTYAQVVVATTSIPMNTQLTDSELLLEEQDVSLLHRGYFTDIQQVRGFVTKRPIPAGQVLTPITVDPAKLVKKGEQVVIIAEGPGISIRAVGEAMTDGALGQIIQVRNTKTSKVVEGRIAAPGQIKVNL